MKRITLISPPPSEAKLFASWLNDPEVVRYSEQRHKVHTVQSQLDYWLSPATLDPNIVLGIYLDKENKFIGSVSAVVDQPNNVANVGILIGDRKEWRKGYGFEAWKEFCDYLFKIGVRKIEAGCMSPNKGMIRIFQKYDMEPEGRREGHFQTKEAKCAMLLYGRFP